MRRWLVFFLALFLLSSCGGSLQDTEDVSDKMNGGSLDRVYLVFDPFSTEKDQPLGIPFPNDIFWQSANRDDGYVNFDTSSVSDPLQRLLFEAVNQLKIEGLSPNTPIFVPLSSDISLSMDSLNGRFFLFDLTVLLSGQTGGELVQNGRLYPLQDGRYLKFYPVKPLDPGHHYLFVLLKGIKDINGKELLPPQIFTELEGEKPLSDPDLEALRLSYKKIYDEVLPILSNLTGVELNRDSVLELFTFTTANKTLSVMDFAQIKAVAEGKTNGLNVTGIPYSQIESDYRVFDSENASQSLLYGALNVVLSNNTLVSENVTLKEMLGENRLFPAFDITKLAELLTALSNNETVDLRDYVKFIPVYIGNGESYNGTVYIFQHGLGNDRTRAENLLQDIDYPVVAIDLPYHGAYTKLTENSTLECGEGKYYLTSNVVANRLNIYQSIFNLRLLELLLRNGVYDIDNDNSTDSVQTVNFVGVSMGAITGSIYARFGTPDKVVLNVGGGNYVSIVDAAKNELIEGLLESIGVEKNTNGYAVLLGFFQLILDPADPVYLGTEDSNSTLIQNACCDTVVPFVSNLALAKKAGFSSFVRLSTDSDFNSPPASPGWYLFGDENHWVHHSFLVHTNLESYPEVQPHTTTDYLLKAERAARKQIEDFFSQ